MPYTLALATAEARDLVVAALRTAADQRTRVARKAAGKVAEDKRAGKDVRSAAVRLTVILAEADDLAAIADELAAATDVPIVTAAPEPEPLDAPRVVEVTEAGVITTVPAPDDDGTSEAAQAIAAAAGLEPALVEDPLTGALPEDEPNPTDVEEVLAP